MKVQQLDEIVQNRIHVGDVILTEVSLTNHGKHRGQRCEGFGK